MMLSRFYQSSLSTVIVNMNSVSKVLPVFGNFTNKSNRSLYITSSNKYCTSTKKESTTRNVDGKEIQNFSQHAADWLNPRGMLKALHSMNQLRVPFIRDGLIAAGSVNTERLNTPTVLSDLQILDVGCGGGILSVPLARLGASVTGLDAGENVIDVAKTNKTTLECEVSDRLKFELATIEEHVTEYGESYDAVVASEVLEHVTDPVSFIRACVKALKPGGSIFITTINKTQFSWFGAILMAENVLKLVPQNSHDWTKFIDPLEVERILKESDCSTVLVNGMWYDFWSNQWSWSKFKYINYAIHAVKN